MLTADLLRTQATTQHELRAGGGVLAGWPVAAPIAAAAAAALVWRIGWSPTTPAILALAILGSLLSVHDVATHRLPHRWTITAQPVIGGLLALASVLTEDLASLARAAAAAAAVFVLFLALCLARLTGGGDMWAASLVALVVGWRSWALVALVLYVAFAFAAITALAMLVSRRTTLHGRIALGPSLFGAAFVVLMMAG